MEAKICSICKLEIHQKYCGNCGQQIGESETTMLSIVSDFFSNLLSVEKSVFACIYKLFTDPKKIVENYWNGNRKYYPSPGKMLFYSFAVAALHLTYVSDSLMGLVMEDGDMSGIGPQFVFWLIILPILILSSYLTFIRKKISVTKHLISIMYLGATFFMLVIILQDVIEYFFPNTVKGGSFVIFFMTVFILNAKVFSPAGNKAKVALNTLLSILILSLIGIVLLGILYLFNLIHFN